MRGALAASAVFNLCGALLFAFPGSAGKMAGLPSPAPRIYTMLVAVFVLLFGGAYAWLARQSSINRPLVAMSAIGKASVFIVICVFWLFGEIPGRSVLAGSRRLIFAALLGLWLVSGSPEQVSHP